jgi:hypothetical protein
VPNQHTLIGTSVRADAAMIGLEDCRAVDTRIAADERVFLGDGWGRQVCGGSCFM